MHDNVAKNMVNELVRINQTLKAMNTNHVDIGRLFKTWLETTPVEMEELELPDRPMFEIDMPVRCIDFKHVFYKRTGVIKTFNSTAVAVEFAGVYERLVYLNPNQVEIVDGPRLLVDMIVEITKPQSAFHGKRGTIVTVLKDVVRVMFKGIEGYSIFTPDEVTVLGAQPYAEWLNTRSFSAEDEEAASKWRREMLGNFHDVTDAEKAETETDGRLLPREWRRSFGMSVLPANWTGINHEEDLMTEEAFRIYQAGVVAGNMPHSDETDEVPDNAGLQ